MAIYHSGLTVKDRKTVLCDFEGCEKKFTKKSNMKAHYRTAHEGLRFVCGKVNTWQSPGLEDWNWPEEGCGQTFVNKAAAEQHVLYVHLGNKRQQYDGPAKTQQKQPSQPKHEASPEPEDGLGFLDEISGVKEHERRQVVCTAPGCTARFMRYADLHGHTWAEHPENATFGLLGASEVPQPDWADADAGAGEAGVGSGALPDEPAGAAKWTQEDANVMQLLDMDGGGAIDPSLFAMPQSTDIGG